MGRGLIITNLEASWMASPSADTNALGFTLCSNQLDPLAVRSNFVAVPFRQGDLDLTTANTDGEPRYNNRLYTARLELSTGTRAQRLATLDDLVARFSGYRCSIQLPDYTDRVLRGRVALQVSYCDDNHAELVLQATCDPLLYAKTAKRYSIPSGTNRSLTLTNAGGASALPSVVVPSGATLQVVLNGSTYSMSAGTHLLPGLLLRGHNTTATWTTTTTSSGCYATFTEVYK